ncbi:hypothetical protein BDA99DRAFT_47206 [Phascolomyces articulosus]|uniref:Serine aminopeptidase S33 domain-containing protein n=1 Tax=Phascolomyces articulosus TaxID=60185 RepID=A0AAD5PDY9_9FUNG|nr:hypothetical protein BDA99DRAFT_47206 [Phascolomyces articulosus]
MTTEKRVEIPGQETIVGILNDKGGSDKRLVLITHGAPGHKNYYFLPLLAQKLSYSSFRFDFRGSGESGGEPKYNNMNVIEKFIEDILFPIPFLHV